MKGSQHKLRAQIAEEAARLMYREGVKEYFTAKRMAAKRLLGRAGGRKMRHRPHALPSNGEIQAALLHLAELAEGEQRTARLAAMRIVALEAMRALEPIAARLIGSVSTGHVRKGSDIDIQVFVDDIEELEKRLYDLGWGYEREKVTIRKFGEIREYVHFHVVAEFAIELTAYPVRELRFRPRSSTDGKPIQRVNAAALEALIEREHPDEWQQYLADGTLPEAGLPDDPFGDSVAPALATTDEPDPGPFDSLLSRD